MQAADIARTEGQIAATKAATDKMASASDADREKAKADWEKAHPDKTATADDINGQLYQNFYNDAFAQTGLGTGGAVQQAIQAATAAVQGLAGGNIGQAISGAAAPYLAEVIHRMTTTKDASGKEVVNTQANLMAHAVVGAVVAAAQGNPALAGASGAALGEYIAQQMYPGIPKDKLTEEQKQTISALGTLAAGLVGGIAGDSTADTLAGAQAGKNAVENNWLSVEEADRKKQLETKRDFQNQELTPAEAKELAEINQTDKERDQAIRAACTNGQKGDGACGSLIGPAQEALKKYGEKVTYSLIYKDLYPQDAQNLESILQGRDAGSISRDQAITAIAQASGVSWEAAASRYDTAMQLHAVTSTLAGFYGLNWISAETKKGGGIIDGAGDSSASKIKIDYKPEGTYINQTSHSSGGVNLCGPTSCAMVINDKKGNTVNLDSVVNQFDNIRPTGVNVNEMSSVLMKNGLVNEPTLTLTANKLKELGLQNKSTIIGVKAGEGNHFLIVDSYKMIDNVGYYMVRDPYLGAMGVRADVLESKLNHNGVILK